MYDFQISNVTLFVLAIDILIGLALTAVPAIFLSKKYKASSRVYVLGMVIMIIFAYIIEGLFKITIAGLPIGKTIYSGTFVTVVYSAFMASLFEETGRFVAMKFWIKKEQGNDMNGYMYGAGHGGLEAFTVLVYSMGVTLYYAFLLKNGQLESMLAVLDETSQNALISQAQTIAGTGSLVYLVAALERICAVAMHMGLSMIVWLGVKRTGKGHYLAIAYAAHFLMELVAGYLGTVSTVATEIMIVLMSTGVMYLSIRLLKQNKQNEQTELV